MFSFCLTHFFSPWCLVVWSCLVAHLVVFVNWILSTVSEELLKPNSILSLRSHPFPTGQIGRGCIPCSSQGMNWGKAQRKFWAAVCVCVLGTGSPKWEALVSTRTSSSFLPNMSRQRVCIFEAFCLAFFISYLMWFWKLAVVFLGKSGCVTNSLLCLSLLPGITPSGLHPTSTRKWKC